MTLVVLDTNALIWFVDGDQNLGSSALQTIDHAQWEGELFVSAFSFWEVGVLVSKARLGLGVSLKTWRDATFDLGVEEIPVNGLIGILSTEMEGLANDPADRIITATAITVGATLVTADRRLLRWDGELQRQDARR
ncbi:MAG: type II toxin-antitoxin system VapC family toxin [Chloroflexi bacterium]|nr:type II toxin-antitoxin system VapC family toxin [Chloroflexota bacterium]